MSNFLLFLLLSTLSLAFLFLVFFNIIRKLVMYSRINQELAHKEIFKNMLEEFMALPLDDFDLNLYKLSRKVIKKSRNFKKVADEYLLELLEYGPKQSHETIRTIAKRLDFFSDCLSQIKSGTPRITAHGARRAGLYNFTEATFHMIAALDYLSNESQFEILLGLARMGRAEPMREAFLKIDHTVIVNERAVIEILNSFPMGDEKIVLFQSIINKNLGKEYSYVTTLFLKAADKKMVSVLTKNIIDLMRDGSKEIRVAAVRSLATLESKAPAKELIRALEDPNWEIRAVAAKAMAQIESQAASLALYNALFDKEWWVRQNAVSSMINHSSYHSLFVLAIETGDKFTRDSIISALENSGEHLLSRSLKLMDADNSFSLPEGSPHAVSLEAV